MLIIFITAAAVVAGACVSESDNNSKATAGIVIA
jgi:hypothetical protein